MQLSVFQSLWGAYVLLWAGMMLLSVVAVVLRSPHAALHRSAFGASIAHALVSGAASVYLHRRVHGSPTLLLGAWILSFVHALQILWIALVLGGFVGGALAVAGAALGVQLCNVLQWWGARGFEWETLPLGIALVATQAAGLALLSDHVTI